MLKKIKRFIYPLLIFTIFTSVISGCSSENNKEQLADLELVTGEAVTQLENDEFEKKSFPVVLGTIEQKANTTVWVNGVTQTIYVTFEGIFREYVVEEGTLVKKGDVIAIADVDTTYEQKQLEILQLRYAHDKKNAEENIANQAKAYDDFSTSVEQETDPYNRKINELKLKKMAIDMDILISNTNENLKRTEDEIAELEDVIDGYDILSPIDGVVYGLTDQIPGKSMQWRTQIAVIFDVGKSQIATSTLVNNLRYGETYYIEKNDGELYEAVVVSKIPDDIRTIQDIDTYYFEIKDKDTDFFIDFDYQNPPVINLYVYKLDQVMVLPEKAIFVEDRATFVHVYADGMLKKRYVDVGLRGNGLVQIIAGLELGQMVYIDGYKAPTNTVIM